jgi:hypothetical protein
MKKHLAFLMSLLLISLVVLNSCKKEEEDDTAYQPAGNYGNANLVSSEKFTLNNWTVYYDDGTNYLYYIYVAWPVITQDIIDHGVLMVYWEQNGRWVALPTTYGAGSYTNCKLFYMSLGQVEIQYTGYNSLGSDPLSYVEGKIVRFVAISDAALQAHPGLDLNDYNEVKQSLQLQDK